MGLATDTRHFISAFLATAGLCVAGCGGSTSDPMTSGDGCMDFVAYSPAFENFRAWESFEIPDSPEPADVTQVHLVGPKTDYLNKRPPHGSTEFPQGTIIVKEVDVGDIPTRQVFALVKRGCDFNEARAPGWEFFELTNDATGMSPSIHWRGFGPPLGTEVYGGDPNACSSCHANARANDYVQSPPLQLSSF